MLLLLYKPGKISNIHEEIWAECVALRPQKP